MESQPAPQPDNTPKIIIAVVVGLVICCALVLIIPVVTIVILALLGPAIGNVFSDIILDIKAPLIIPSGHAWLEAIVRSLYA